MEIYAYTMVTDSGFAPAVKHGLLSLACCKTRLRYKVQDHFKRKATDIFVIGLAGVQLQRKIEKNNELKNAPYYPFYIARITDVVSTEEYFDSKKYADRPDCQYMLEGNVWCYKAGNPHNPKKGKKIAVETDNKDLFYAMRKGRARQPYDYNAVLLSDDYCILGRNQDKDLPTWVKDKICLVRKNAWRSDLRPIQDIEEMKFLQFYECLKGKDIYSVKNRRDTIDPYFLNKQYEGKRC